MRILRGAYHPRDVLGDDVLQEGRFPGPGHPEDDPLHDPDLIGPIPRLAVDVVAQHHGVLAPRFLRESFIALGRNYERRVRPLLLAARPLGPEQPAAADHRGQTENNVYRQLLDLAVRQLVAVHRDVPAKPGNRKQYERRSDLHALEHGWVFAVAGVRGSHGCPTWE